MKRITKIVKSFPALGGKMLMIALFLSLYGLHVQGADLYAVSRNGPTLYSYDTVTWSQTNSVTLTSTSYTINWGLGLTYNPQNGKYYAILVTGSGRRLVTVVPSTGVCTDIGAPPGGLSSITFAPNGRLFGVTGTDAGHSLYKINPSNASATSVATLTNGLAGQIIAFNPDDGYLYHWTYQVFEKIDTVGYVSTSISMSGNYTDLNEPFGAVYKGNGSFIVND